MCFVLLQDLLQDVKHEDRRLQEIESLTAALLKSCTTEGQMALSQDVQSLLNKKTMLQTSIHKQLGREGYQKAEQGCFEVRVKIHFFLSASVGPEVVLNLKKFKERPALERTCPFHGVIAMQSY